MGKSFCVETLGSKSGAAAMPESSHFVCLCPLPCMWLGGWGTLLGYEKLQRRSWAVGRGRHFCRLLSGLEMKTTRTTKYRSLSSPLFGHLQAKCWVVVGGTWLRITSWSLLGGAAPGHTGDEDTGGTSDIMCHVWLRRLCRFFGGNWWLNKFPMYSAHKQVSGAASRWQDRGSAIRRLGAQLQETVQHPQFKSLDFCDFTEPGVLPSLLSWGHALCLKKLLKWLCGWHIVLMIKCMKHTALALWRLKH